MAQSERHTHSKTKELLKIELNYNQNSIIVDSRHRSTIINMNGMLVPIGQLLIHNGQPYGRGSMMKDFSLYRHTKHERCFYL